MISNSLLIEMIVKERQQAFEQEAREIQITAFVKNRRRTLIAGSIERFADLLISYGEYLKKKYSPEPVLNLSKDTCSC